MKRSKIFMWGLIILLALAWGMSFLFTTISLKKLGAIELLSIRWTISALIFLVLIIFGKIRINFKGAGVKYMILTGLLQPCIYSLFETNGIGMTSTSVSSIFIATIPSAVLLLGIIIFHKPCNFKMVVGIVMSFGGVIVCTVLSSDFSISGEGSGYLVMLGAVVCGGFYSHASAKAGEYCDALSLTAVISIMGCIFFNVINLIGGNGFSGYVKCFGDGKLLLSVLFLGLFCSCICYIIFNYALAKLPAATAANMCSGLTTCIGIISGCLLAGDPFGWYIVVGVAMMLAGVWISSNQ